MTPDQQVEEVMKVKRFTNFIVTTPHTVRSDTTISQLLDDIIPSTGNFHFNFPFRQFHFIPFEI